MREEWKLLLFWIDIYHFKHGSMSLVHINDLRVGPLKHLSNVHPMCGTGLPLPSRHCTSYIAHLQQEFHYSKFDIFELLV